MKGTGHPGPGAFARFGPSAAVALGYFAAGALTLLVPQLTGPVALFWLPTGIGVAALLRIGLGFWPWLFAASVATGALFGFPAAATVGAALGSVGGQVLVVALLRRCSFDNQFSRRSDIGCFAGASALGLAVPAVADVALLRLAGKVPAELTAESMVGWWMGDWMAVVAFGPLFLTSNLHNARLALRVGWRNRFWLLGLLLAAVSVVLPADYPQMHTLPWIFVPVAVMCAATMRFGRPAAIVGLPLFATLVLLGSLWNMPPGHPVRLFQTAIAQDWMVLAGVGAIGWLLAALQLERHREMNERVRAEGALREREHMLRAVVDNAPLGIWMQNRAGRLLFVNRAFCSAVGIPEERFLGVPHYAELYDPATAASCMASDREALAQAGPHLSYEKLRFTDGEVHDVEIIKSRLVDPEGEIIGLIGISLDITARKMAEESLQTLGTALNTTANAVVIAGREGRIEWTNAAFTSLSGYTREESVGRTPGELLKSGRHGQQFYRDLWDTILAGRTWRGQTINRRKDGSIYTEEQTITPMRDTAGTITRFIAIKEDVSALVGAQGALRESEERYRLLFDGNPVPMWVANPESRAIMAVNDSALRQYGYTRDEFLALKLDQLRPPEDIPLFDDYMRKRDPDQDGPAGEWRHQRKNGSVLTVDIHSSPVRFAGGIARLVTALDITEKKKLQEQVMRTQRMESIGLLAAGIAHDLNNILTPMRMVGPMLRAQVLNPDDQRILSLVDHSAERGAALVRQILAFAHGTGSEQGPLQLKESVRDVALFIRETFPREMRFEQSVPADLWAVVANPTQVHQVLLNLCVNARDAMGGKGGVLRLTASNRRLSRDEASQIPGARAGAFVCLEVGDTGCGIAPAHLPHIWEPFFTTKGPGVGTGLGLSTVRGIVSAHKGFCAVESTLGLGTTFRIFLPAIEESAAAAAETSVPPGRGRDELILIVDDESFVRDAVRDALRKHGYRTLTAQDGIEALRLIELHHAELSMVVTDLRMPQLGGERLIAILRETYPDLLTFAMSGDTDKAAFAGVPGPHAFISKPFKLDEFRTVVDRLLHQGKGG